MTFDTVSGIIGINTAIEEVYVMTYEIAGGNLPVVICQLEDGEWMSTDKGAMS